MNVPVVFIIFNRPDTTQRVFAEIAKAKPPKLLVIADGPRENRPGEAEKCRTTRAIVEQINWDCDLLTNYSETNLGCKKRISSGLDWVFETVDEAIILEDDCLPHPSFFRFCEELLARYRDDERIMQISGNNFQLGHQRTNESYYFSHLLHIWGWASWRRAWQFYDVRIKQWPTFRKQAWLNDVLDNRQAAAYWAKSFESAYADDDFSAWSIQWIFACWMQHGLSIVPNVNLVSNIGFGRGAAHTTNINWLANMPVEPIDFPLRHPPFVVRNKQADAFTQQTMFGATLLERAKGKLIRLWRSHHTGLRR